MTAGACPASGTRCTASRTRARRASTSSRRRRGSSAATCALLTHVADAYADASGRRLPINGAGAAGAALLDVGVPAGSVRGFVLIARTAGLVAHLAEEAEDPIGPRLWHEVEERSQRS